MNGITNVSKKLKKHLRSTFKRIFNNTNSIQTPNTSDKFAESISTINSTNQSTNYYKYQLESFSGDKNDMIGSEKDSMTPINLPSPTTDLDQTKISETDQTNKSDNKKDDSQNISGGTTSINTSSKLLCPYNKHHNLKEDEPCVCINLEQLKHHRKQAIESEWHKFQVEPTTLDQLSLVKQPLMCIQGGQGVVFMVSDEQQRHRKFALKMKLRENKGNNSWLIEQREVNLLKMINHNFIVSLFHVHETASAMFMTMEYLEGGCLWSHVAKKGTLPESYSIYYSACVLDALKFLHSTGVVYRDLKAENIVLDGHGRPKLIDFGMAKQIGHSISKSSKFKEKGGRGEEADENIENCQATQYYYAGYLAPEIYTKPCTANVNIDSWGIGYVISEIVLGYGVFVTMPWEAPVRKDNNDSTQNSESKNTSPNNSSPKSVNKWTVLRSKLEQESSSSSCTPGGPISSICRDLLTRTLVYNPLQRLTLDEISRHPFYWSIPSWSILPYIKPPDLSHFLVRARNSLPNSIKAVSSPNFNSDFVWSTTLYNSNNCTQTPDFTPSLLSQGVDLSKCKINNQNIISTNNNFSAYHKYPVNYLYHNVATPQDIPLNPRAPYIRLYNTPDSTKSKMRDPTDLYREYKININSYVMKNRKSNQETSTIDTISNLKPNWQL